MLSGSGSCRHFDHRDARPEQRVRLQATGFRAIERGVAISHCILCGAPQAIADAMLDRLRQFISDVVSPSDRQRTFDETDYRLAATALLIHVISLDGEPSEVETRKLHALLELRFQLDAGTADKLIAEAMRAEGEAVDMYHFTRVIMRSVDEAGRLRIIEMMWELVYADGHASEFEDSVVWRAADLLGVSSRDRIDLKRQVSGQKIPVQPVSGQSELDETT